ncbi:hypothetical protein KY361_03900 [Candidatus Woesearchaeota archaeon]|nr:hypothetical protein [Candidatus Woesearchaeota archaeon]
MNKKGIELSVNFLVTIILAITIFVFGIMFARNLLGGAEDITRMSEEDLDAKMDDLMCPGDERVCFGVRTKTAKRGELVIFGIRILNVLDDPKEFIIEVNAIGAILKGERDITNLPNLVIFKSVKPLAVLPERRTETIDTNDDMKIGVGIQPANNAPPGKYILDIYVRCPGCDEEVYGYNKLYVEVK